MFNTLSHEENANQNDTEILFHPNQYDHHQENKPQKMLERMWGEKSLCTLLVRI
jgi:hypothetical protein